MKSALILKVSKKTNVGMAKLIADSSCLNCQISIDMANGEIVIEKADESVVTTLIEAVEEAFDITEVEIIPTIEAEASDIETVKPTESENKKKEKTELESELISDEPTEQTDLDLKGDSEEKDDSVIPEDAVQFVKFSNKGIEEQMNNLLKVIFGVIKYKGADDKDICKFIMTTKYEILSKYAPQNVYFQIGDIVDCNYGNHLKGELSGGHIYALICYVDEGNNPYVIPMVKNTPKIDDRRYLSLTVNDVKMYDSPDYKEGTLLLCKGSFINEQRIRGVIGNVSEEFLDKVLKALPAAVAFYNVSDESYPVSNSTQVVEDAEYEGVSDNKTKKITKFEYLMQNPFLINGVRSIENLASESSSIEFKAEVFLEAIGFPKDDERIAINAFVAACDVKKIAWSEVLDQVCKTYNAKKRNNIKELLQTMFNEWAKKHTDIKSDCPNMAFTELLRFFVKVISKN